MTDVEARTVHALADILVELRAIRRLLEQDRGQAPVDIGTRTPPRTGGTAASATMRELAQRVLVRARTDPDSEAAAHMQRVASKGFMRGRQQ